MTEYFYLMGFPISIPNIIWCAITLLLLASYYFNYVSTPDGFIGTVFRYFVQYGKVKSNNSRFDLPKRFFTHYYILATLWNLACFITITALCFGNYNGNWLADLWNLKEQKNPKSGDQLSILIVMFMISIHSIKRLYECVAVSVFSSKAKINIIQYIWGFVFYLLLAPTLISESLPLKQLPLGTLQLRHVIGIAGFCFASFIHHQSHVIFANMRRIGGLKQDSHGIPQGGFFSLVSCPHYLAEVLIYLFTLVIVGAQCRSWWIVFGYNIVAHANMATSSHRWYKENFSSYPSNRKAYIPFLF